MFDFDGTLVDASAAILHGFYHVLDLHGRPRWPEEQVRARIGRPLREMLAEAFPAATPADIARYIEEYRAAFHPVSRTLSRPMPGFLETIPELACHLKLAIATSRKVGGAVHILEGWGMERYFAAIVGIDEVTEAKPHPEAVQQALERLGVPAARAAMIGDTPDDVIAGRTAGAWSIGVSSDAARRAELRAAGADFVVPTLFDLKELLLGEIPGLAQA